MEFRCPGRIHFVVLEDGRIEVKCRSAACGARAGVVVLHYFDQGTGELIETKKFSDPAKFTEQEENGNAHRIHTPSLRVP